MADGERSQPNATTSGAARRYAAFISYSHADEEIANWLHRRLENYQIPKALARGRRSQRIGKVFRDRVELSAAHDLGGEIRKALEQSDALIVLCSPRSARSQYVHEEIRYFKELGRGDRILAAIVSGEPHAAGKPGRSPDEECFPRALLFRLGADTTISTTPEAEEPIAADVRAGKDGRESGALKLLAGLIGVGLDELVEREKQAERARRLRTQIVATAMSVLALGATIAGGLAWWQSGVADAARQVAQDNEKRAVAGEKLASSNAEREAVARAEADRQRGEATTQSQIAGRERDLANTRETAALVERSQAAMLAYDYEAAAMLALEGLPKSPLNPERPISQAALHALSGASSSLRPIAALGGGAAYWDVAGDMVAMCFSSGRATFWRLKPYAIQLASVDLFQGIRFKCALDPKGRRLVAAGSGEVTLVDATNGKVLHRWPIDDRSQTPPNVGFADGGRFAYAMPDDGSTMRFWNVETGAVIATVAPRTAVGGSPAPQYAVGARNADLVVTGSDFGIVRLWQPSTGAEIKGAATKATQSWLHSLSVSADGRYIFTMNDLRGGVTIWQVHGDKLVRVKDFPTASASNPESDDEHFSRTSNTFWLSFRDNRATEVHRIVETEAGPEVVQVTSLDTRTQAVIAPGDRGVIVSGGKSHSLGYVDLPSGLATGEFSFRAQPLVTSSFTARVRAQVNDAGDRMVVFLAGSAVVWDISAQRAARTFTVDDDFIESASVSNDKVVLSSMLEFTADGTRRQAPAMTFFDRRTGDSLGRIDTTSLPNWRTISYGLTRFPELDVAWATDTFPTRPVFNVVATGQQFAPFTVPSGISSRCTLPDHRLVTLDRDGKISVWKLDPAKLSGELEDQSSGFDPFRTLLCSTDGKVIVARKQGGGPLLWRVGKSKTEPDFLNGLQPLSISPSGRFLVVAFGDGVPALIDLQTGSERMLPIKSARSATFSPDDTRLLVSTDSGYATVMATADLRVLGTFGRHERTLATAQFSADGRIVATRSADLDALWYSDTGILLASSQPNSVVVFSDTRNRLRTEIPPMQDDGAYGVLVSRGPSGVWTERTPDRMQAAFASPALTDSDRILLGRMLSLGSYTVAERALLGLPSTSVEDPGQTECDRLASHAWDAQRRAPSVSFEALNGAKTLAACDSAIAAAPAEARFLYLKARALMKLDRRPEAIPLLQQAVAGGHQMANTGLVTAYRDLKKTAEAQATLAEGVSAQFPSALMQQAADLREKDPRRSGELLAAAALAGIPNASQALGEAYEHGERGKKANLVTALEWYARAANQARAHGEIDTWSEQRRGTISSFLVSQGKVRSVIEAAQAAAWPPAPP